MTSIQNSLPKFIPAFNEVSIPIEEEFLEEYLDKTPTFPEYHGLQKEIEKYKDGLETRKGTSNNAMLAHIYFRSMVIFQKKNDIIRITEEGRKFLAESLPKVEKILKDSEKGTKEYSRAAYLISQYMTILGEKEKAKHFLKLGADEGYGFAMLQYGNHLEITKGIDQEKVLGLYQAAAKQGIRSAKIFCQSLERGSRW